MLGIRTTILGLCAAASLLLAAGAQAQSPSGVLGPYDGQIPFKCELQQLGTGTDYPDPDADPLCVEFDKTNQNVTEFGIVDFAAQEPARVAAAGTKCFYFQRDHWTGSIQQGQDPEVWHWNGDYWYDRARGVGGVSVRNFRLGGTPMSATPYVPEAYQPYFDETGGGGAEVLLESGPDPSCAAKVDTPEERNQVYGDRPEEQSCIDPGGGIRGLRVGRTAIGDAQAKVRKRLGPPSYSRGRFDAWCLAGKGELRIAYSRGEHRVEAILTSGRGQSFHGVGRGDRERRARRLLDVARDKRIPRVGHILFAGAYGTTWICVREGRVRWVMIYDPVGDGIPDRMLTRVP